MKKMSGEKIIIVEREKRRGCGCTTVLLLVGLVIAGGAYIATDGFSDRPAGPSKASAPSPVDAEPDEMIRNLMIDKYFRQYLHDPDSVQKISTRRGVLTNGWMYVVEYRAKNAFGAYVKSAAALQYDKNTKTWTSYENVSEALDVVRASKKALADNLQNRNVDASAKSPKSSRESAN